MFRRILFVGILGMSMLSVCGSQSTTAPTEAETAAIVRVAYPKPDGPWMWTEGEAPRSLAEGVNSMDVRISGDGEAVAWRGGTNWELFATLVDEGEPVMLLDRAYLDTLTPESGGFVTVDEFDFGAQRHTLYFNTNATGRQQYDLYRVDVSGSAPMRIFQAGAGGNFTFSPNGQWMTLYHPQEIVLARPDGREARVVFNYPENASIGSRGPQIAWAEDSSGFFVMLHGERSPMPQPMAVWFVPVQGDPVERMKFQGYLGAYISPDGGSVVYFDPHDGTTDVHFVDPEGTDTLYASLGSSVFFMDWAPDSRHFIIDYQQVRSDSPETIDVPYLCALGEDPVRLIDTPTAYPAYWVDNSRVLYFGDGLRLQELGKASALIDDGLLVNDFDFTLLTKD